jgi:hypothetical protein
MAVAAPFIWGTGGSQMTPEEIAAQRKVAQAMIAQGSDYSPVQSWSQGAARVAQAIFGGMQARDANEAAKANAASEAALLTGLFSGGAPTNIVPPAAAAAPSVAASAITSAPLPPVASTAPDSGLTDAIAKAASARGVDPAYLTRLAKVETGGNVNATTPLSSAGGPFQFIDATAKQYGLNNRFDVNESADAAARLTLDNKAALTQALGREPTAGELYLAHQQGSGGAAKILTADPHTPIENVIGFKAAANNGAVPGMTAGQFANKWTSRFADIGAQPTATAQADPAALPVNAQSTQGYAIPGQPAPAVQTVAQAMPQSGVNPRVLAAMASPYVSDGTKRVLGIMLQSQLASEGVTPIDAGNKIILTDKRGNVIREMAKGEPNKGPEYGVIAKDAYGNEQYGWRDPRTKTVTPFTPPNAAAGQPVTVPGPDGKPIVVPANADPKVYREAASKAGVANALPASFDDTTKLRHEVSQLPAYKNLAQAAPIYKSMLETAGTNSKASDLNLVYGLGKIFDPNSVVREGEMVMVKNTASLPDWLIGTANALNGGQALTPETRQAILKEAYNRIQSYKSLYDQDTTMYRAIAERNRMNPADVVQDFGEFKPYVPASTKPVVIDGYTIKAK